MKIVLLLLFILSVGLGFSQKLVVSATKMNVVYVGVDNPISIAAINVSPEKYIVSTNNNCIMSPVGNGDFILRAKQSGICEITVMAENDTLGKQLFSAHRLPDPIAKVGSRKEGRVPVEYFEKFGYINLEKPDGFDFDVKYSIVSFRFLYITDGGTPVELLSRNNRFTPEMIRTINKFNSGDIVTFQDIKVKCPDGERFISPISFAIQ
ncbi:MAG: GldM family protein [Bacteroidota bacterium]|nr:GldM family protein [Bacteroidota bacterium]